MPLVLHLVRSSAKPLNYKILAKTATTRKEADQASSVPSEAEGSQLSPWQPKTKLRDDGMLLVFDGDPPAPSDDEPIFWSE